MFLDTKLNHLLKVDSGGLEIISSNNITWLNLAKVSTRLFCIRDLFAMKLVQERTSLIYTSVGVD